MRQSVTSANLENEETDQPNEIDVLFDQYYGQQIDQQRINKINKKTQEILLAGEEQVNKINSKVDTFEQICILIMQVLVQKNQSNEKNYINQIDVKNHSNYNFNKIVNQKQQNIPIRENFKNISDQLHDKTDRAELLSQRVIFNQANYGQSKTFLFKNDIEIAKHTQSIKDSKSPNELKEKINPSFLKSYSYKTPYGQEFNISLQQKYDMKKVSREIRQKYEGEELNVSHKKMTVPADGLAMDLTIDSIFNFQEESRQDRLPQDLTQELMSSFREFKDFTGALKKNEHGDYILGQLEQKTFEQLVTKRGKILQEDTLDRGQLVPNLKQQASSREVHQVNRDLYLIFNDPHNQIYHDTEDTHVDSDNLQFKDITSFLADRIKPEQIMFHQKTNSSGQHINTQDGQFDSFKPYDEKSKTQTLAKDITSHSQKKDTSVQTDNLQKSLARTFNLQFTLFQKIQKEVEEIKSHKNRYQSDLSYIRLLNSHILQKLNQLWITVREFEKEFEQYDTISESIEVIHRYVFNLKGRQTNDGNTKAEVLLWIMREFKQLCDEMARIGSLEMILTKNATKILGEMRINSETIKHKQIIQKHVQKKSTAQTLTSSITNSAAKSQDPLTRKSSNITLKRETNPQQKINKISADTKRNKYQLDTSRTVSIASMNPSRAISPQPSARRNLLESYQYGNSYSPFRPISKKIKDSEKSQTRLSKMGKLQKSFF